MSLNYIYIFALILYATIQLLHLLRAVGTNTPIAGQIVYSSINIWLGINAFAYYFNFYNYELEVLSSWLSLFLINIFFTKYLSNHINLSNIQRAFSALGSASLIVLPFLPVEYELKLKLTGFFGVVYTLVLFFYSERLYHLLKAENKGHGSLPFSLCGYALVHFFVFCDIALTFSINNYHSTWILSSLIILTPLLKRGIDSLENLNVKLSISKPVAFHATLLSITGMYLVGVSGISYGMKAFNLEISYASQVTLLIAFIFPLVYLLASTKIRKEIFVWINKNFFSSQFNYRETWTNLSQRLSPDLFGEEASSRGLGVILSSVNSERGAYYQLKNGEWVLAASENCDLSNIESELFSFFNELSSNGWVVDLEDVHSKPKLYPFIKSDSTALCGENVKWIIPAMTNDNVEGMWVVIHSIKNSNYQLNWEVRDHLHLLSQQLDTYLKTQETRRQYEVNAQFAAFHQMSAFVIHDLKNVYAQLSMVNKNALLYKDNPEFINDVFLTLGSMEKRLNKTLNQLTNKQRQSCLEEGNSIASVYSVLSTFKDKYQNSSDVELHVTPGDSKDCYIQTTESKLESVLVHLTDNAIQACAKADTKIVKVLCEKTDNHVIISILDTGCGMTEDFLRDRLFKPFESTKGNSGMGLGAYDAQEFTKSLGGNIKVNSGLDKGTLIQLNIPRNGVHYE